MSNQQLANEHHKPIIKIFFKRGVYYSLIRLMQLISKFNKGIRFLLCVIHLLSKYAWVVPLKVKTIRLKGITIASAFHKVLNLI